ncbi:MAG TPA: calcium-binding protein, partial [Roseimicrobium sp.]|nr:calcium-binding protein [Roseimicrobium sp.]
MSNKVFMTLWDGGGTDTYDFSAYTAGLKVSLQPGEWSTLSAEQVADLGSGHHAAGNVANALLYNGNPASLIENVIGGSGGDTLKGNAANNSLTGGGGNDWIDGLGGVNTATYSGNAADYAYQQNANGSWTVADLRSGGTDGVDTLKHVQFLRFNDQTIDLGPCVEVITCTSANDTVDATHTIAGQMAPSDAVDMVYGMAGNDSLSALGGDDHLYGGDGADSLYGGLGNDQLDGGSAADKMFGGAGDDTFLVDNTADVVTENANQGTDSISASVSYTLAANLENLTLTGLAGLAGTGNDLGNGITGNEAGNALNGLGGNDLLTGLAGNDRLDGGAGADRLFGGLGRDTYVVDNAGDVVDETDGDGTDTVLSSISFRLGDAARTMGSVENLSLLGSASIFATGNALNNTLIGNAGANILTGLAGDDTLDGGSGADTLFGGTGNDRYVIDNTGDVAKETDGDGTDTIVSSISFSLADAVHAIGGFENLTLTGSGAINATGNALDNVLTGNGVNNVLIGGIGADRLDGGGGADTASYASSGSGVAVSLALGTGIGGDAEGDRLFNIENLTGSNFNDTLEGNAGNNNLVGGLGIDTVSYANVTSGTNSQGVTVNLGLTSAQNTIRAGTDTLSGFENLTGSQFNDTLTGSSGNNIL